MLVRLGCLERGGSPPEGLTGIKRGLYLAAFDQLADPRVLADLAGRAEASGWDGVFLWDRIAYPPQGRAVADPWVALSAIAVATETLRLGPLVTPLARRRVQKITRESVTLDQLSDGRLTMGVGLGNPADFVSFGEVVDPRERGRVLDESLERLDRFWRGEFNPLPVQRPGFRSGWRRTGPIAVRSDARCAGTGCSRSTFPGPSNWPCSPRRSPGRVGVTITSIWLSTSPRGRRSAVGSRGRHLGADQFRAATPRERGPCGHRGRPVTSGPSKGAGRRNAWTAGICPAMLRELTAQHHDR